MLIHEFRDKLMLALVSTPIPQNIRIEKDFERRFVIPIILRVSNHEMDVRTYTHPWNNKARCQPDCETAPNHGRVVVGCPRCWASSKKWASVLAFGTNHTFDAVAKDTRGNRLVVEAKLIAVKGGRMPNGEIQRLMGQCTLAKTKHQFVIGICGYRGTLDPRWDNDTQAVTRWFEQAGISLIFRAVS